MSTSSFSKNGSVTHYLLELPSYKLWPYEEVLARGEVTGVSGTRQYKSIAPRTIRIRATSPIEKQLRRLTFFHRIEFVHPTGNITYATNQALTEATAKVRTDQEPLGGDKNREAFLLRFLKGKKEPNYATHGLHKFKGKFYPQLVKSLFNIASLQPGDLVLDPFAGSGTALVEACLNGLRGIGIEINPLAAEIANTKVACLSLDARKFRSESDDLLDLLEKIEHRSSVRLGEKATRKLEAELDYLASWFSAKTLRELLALAGSILEMQNRTSRRFALLILSDILRDVSLQDPHDLRIRRRAKAPTDQSVVEMFRKKFLAQRDRLFNFLRFRDVCAPQFGEAECWQDDARKLASPWQGQELGEGSVDLIVTSPPYATALPYIDTDRLSLAFLGLAGRRERSRLESDMIGNREISNADRERIEVEMAKAKLAKLLPPVVFGTIFDILERNSKSPVGFRRKNKAALIYKYFIDMQRCIDGMFRVLKPGKLCMVIVGNNVTTAGTGRLRKQIEIRTDDFLEEIARRVGFRVRDRIPITVTSEDYKHVKNFIDKNAILVFEKPA